MVSIGVGHFELKILSEFKIYEPKMVRFLKIKFLIKKKFNFNGGQFYKKKMLIISKKL